MLRRFKIIDLLVAAGLVGFAAVEGGLYALLAAIVLLLYLILRQLYAASQDKAAGQPEPGDTKSEDDDAFIVYEGDDRFASSTDIQMDRDIDLRPAKGRLRLYSQYDLSIGMADYEYKCEGTKLSIRLINEVNEGESEGFKREWVVRDGVVLETDLRERDAKQRFRAVPIDEQIESLRTQIEWREVQPAWWNGFKYFAINRCLPGSDARRYLRQELERLKTGNAKALKVAAEKYGLELDPDKKSFDGWKRIEGREDIDCGPFWEELKSGTYGISEQECGQSGLQFIADLQRLLGDTVGVNRR